MSSGQIDNLRADREYVLQVNLTGQNLRVLVDSVPVIDTCYRALLKEGRSASLLRATSELIFGFRRARWPAQSICRYAICRAI